MTAPAVFHKRFRMEADLRALPPVPALPAGWAWVAWSDAVLDLHAAVKCRAFAGGMDASIFPSLGRPDGCVSLMKAIRRGDGFCPGSTWLVRTPDGFAGTVQGAQDEDKFGAVQNLGVVPECRGSGVGSALLLKCLDGFRTVGITRACLEVTAANLPAVALYRRHGFRCARTIYKPANGAKVAETSPPGPLSVSERG